MKKLRTFLLVMIVLLVPLQTQAKTKKPKFDYSDDYIAIGQTMKLDIINTKSKVKWSVSNKKVSITKKGKRYVKVKGKNTGTVYVKAKIGKKIYKKKLKVFKPQINTTSEEIFIGDEIYLTLYGKSDKIYQWYSTLPIKWKSSDNNIVTVDEYGICQAVGVGTCTITATLYGKSYTCTITSKEPYVSKKALESTTYEKTDISEGYLLKITNSYIYPTRYRIYYTFTKNGKATYSDDDSVIADSNSTVYYCIWNYDNGKTVQYDDISITLEPEFEESYPPVNKQITVEKQYGNNEVMGVFTNPCSKTIYVKLIFVFYKDGKIVSTDSDSKEIGANNKGIIKVSYPYKYDNDDNIQDIDFDDFEVLIGEAYMY